MGRALMARLLSTGRSDDYVAPVELVERASLQPPRIVVHQVPATVRAATG